VNQRKKLLLVNHHDAQDGHRKGIGSSGRFTLGPFRHLGTLLSQGVARRGVQVRDGSLGLRR
jgi:hypothetical protein